MKKYLIKLCKPEFKILVLEVAADCANKTVIDVCKVALQGKNRTGAL